MVNFKLSKRLDFKKFKKKETAAEQNGVSDIPLNVSLPEKKAVEKGGNAWLKNLGNLLLVAAGVFIALYAYNSLGTREAAEQEVVYLRNFQRDVEDDVKRLKNSIDINSSRILDVKEILGDLYRSPDSVNLASFNNRYISAIYVSKFSPIHPTFNDFKTRNQTGILNDPQLRNDIFRYYDQVEQAVETIASYELHHQETFVPTFTAEYIKGRTLIIFKKYYEDINEDSDPDLSLWRMSKDNPVFIEAENLLLQRLLYLDRSLDIEKDLLQKAEILNRKLSTVIEELG